MYFNSKKLISNCVISETNKYIYRNGYLCDCKNDTRQGL